MIYLDLFAGAGGLSEGFMRAGCEAIAHVEMNQDAINTIKTRLCYYHLRRNNQIIHYNDYLQGAITRDQLYELVPDQVLNTALCYAMSEENLGEIFTNIDNLMLERGEETVDIIVGGPPCQAYSLAGRAKQRRDAEARANGSKEKDDQRKYLYRLYCQFLQRYNPEMFVFENVPGLLSSDGGRHFNDILVALRSSGYEVDWRLLNASDFGVPQNRKRLIIIGWRNGTRHRFPEFVQVAPTWTIADILRDLPVVQSGERAHQYRRVQISPYVEERLRNDNDILTWHAARPNIERDREIYRIAIRTWNEHSQRLSYPNLPAELRTHQNTKDFTDRFKVVASNIPYCHTVLAHISKDGHYYIHPDIAQARSLTVREAARIQSFPDNYYFEGSRTSAFMQIGNAVPPIMAETIARSIRTMLLLNRR